MYKFEFRKDSPELPQRAVKGSLEYVPVKQEPKRWEVVESSAK